MRKREVPTGAGIRRSTRTKFVETTPEGADIYSHTSRYIAGMFVIVNPTGTPDGWRTADNLEGARRVSATTYSEVGRLY